VCSLFFIIKTPPNDTRTSPNSSGWWDQDINPSIPKRSWDKESAKPEINWIIVPTITSMIPVLRDLWTDFLNKRMQPMNAAQLVIDTPVYTMMCWMLQKNSGSCWRWDIASQSPAETTITDPITAKIEIINTNEVGFTNVEFVILWINFI